MTFAGTSHFKSIAKALDYYKITEGSMADAAKVVGEKMRDGSISIGPPIIKPGEKLSINAEGRYVIES